MEREILHVNTDDFYASVLRLRDRTLRERAVVVAGPPPRGMVLSASYEARRDGVARGMTVSTAMRLCSRGVFLPPDWGLFRRASRAILTVLGRYSPVVETTSLDEGYVDYTGCSRLLGHVLDAGRRIRNDVLAETGLEVSLGVASNKLVSHVASRTAKCANLVDVYPGYEGSFLAPLPIDRFPVVGVKRAPLLRELGISCVGDILLFTEEILAACFGSWGSRLYRGALGKDDTPVRVCPVPDERFTVDELLEPDSVDRRFLEAVLYRLAERLGERLRSERSRAGALVIEVGYADARGDRATERLVSPTADDLLLFGAAERAFARTFTRRVRVRRLVVMARRIELEPLQLELFAGKREMGADRMQRLRTALDGLRKLFPEGVAPAFGRAVPAVRAGDASCIRPGGGVVQQR
jgi:DNA polymerase-4